MTARHPGRISDTLGREPIHPFPARMAPSIALDVMAESTGCLRVLDPMVGSGTVVAVARSKGHRALGFDIDPLAVLISKVWTSSIDHEAVREAAHETLNRAREVFRTLRTGDAYPENADRETRRFICYWFDEYSRRQLASIARGIERVRDQSVRDVLWCGFSRLIITKQAGASRAMDLSHSRPHRSFGRAPVKPFRKFVVAVEHVIENCIDATKGHRGPVAYVREADARSLPVRDASVDLVLTSPPYLNAIDYMRCSKFSLVWMGHGVRALRKLRAESVGAEIGDGGALEDREVAGVIRELKLTPALEPREEAMLARYVADMRRSLQEIARVLVPGGRAVYVVGENTVRGTYIRNSLVVSGLAQSAGLLLKERKVRLLPANRRYLPPPPRRGSSARLSGRMRREVILTFRKPG